MLNVIPNIDDANKRFIQRTIVGLKDKVAYLENKVAQLEANEIVSEPLQRGILSYASFVTNVSSGVYRNENNNYIRQVVVSARPVKTTILAVKSVRGITHNKKHIRRRVYGTKTIAC